VKLCVELGLMIWFLAGLHLGVIGLFDAMLVGEALALVFMACLVLPVTGLRFSRTLFRSMALFVLPLVPTGLLQFWLHSGDRFVLKAATDNSQVGIYSLAYNFGTVPSYALLAPFMMVWFPYVFSLADDDTRRQIISRVTPYFMFAMTACCLVVSLFAREAVVLMAQQPGFHVAWPAVPLICAGYWCWSLFKVVETGFYVVKRTDLLPLLTGIAAATNVLLNLVLIPKLGFMGSAWATLVTFALLVIMGVRAARPVFAVDWPWRRMLMPALSAVLLCGAGVLADLTPGLASLGIKSAAITAWLAWMWAGGFLDREERRAVAAAVQALLRKRRG
jgi:O-antigen/teichoic acid export membrane protein